MDEKQKLKKIVKNMFLTSVNGSACGAFFFVEQTRFLSFSAKRRKSIEKKKLEL